MIKPLSNNIIFQFINKRSSNKGMFEETTASGIKLLANDKDSSKSPRWGHVCHIGPNVKDVKVDDYVLIEPLMWTEAIKHDDEEFSKTDESKVMLISTNGKPALEY